MRVAVMLGGESFEKDVSIKTGKAVIEACKQNKIKVEPVMIDKNYQKVLPILKTLILYSMLYMELQEKTELYKVVGG